MATRKTKEPAHKVLRCGIEKDEGFVYLFDRSGAIVCMPRGGGKFQTVLQTKLRREKGYMYFLDDDGDLVKAPDR